MTTLWTPDGERPIRRQPEPTPAPPPGPAPQGDPTGVDAGAGGEGDDAATVAQMEELRTQMASAPPEMVVANHAYGLFELARVHISLQPPQLEEARLAIDAMGALVEGLAGRLGDNEPDLIAALAQLRMVFVQVQGMPPPPAP